MEKVPYSSPCFSYELIALRSKLLWFRIMEAWKNNQVFLFLVVSEIDCSNGAQTLDECHVQLKENCQTDRLLSITCINKEIAYIIYRFTGFPQMDCSRKYSGNMKFT